MEQPVYKRVLLKISGEALAGTGGGGIDFDMLGVVADTLKDCLAAGVQVGLVVGGGNFWRGAKQDQMERSHADQMGMLATLMNALALADVCERRGVPARVLSALEIPAAAELYTYRRAIQYLNGGRVVVFGAGTGRPYFSTDTGAALRAAEIHADALLLAKNIDGVYSADPKRDPGAVKYEAISYAEVLEKRLAVMDLTATSLAMDNAIPAVVFALKDPRNILRVLRGEKIGTVVTV